MQDIAEVSASAGELEKMLIALLLTAIESRVTEIRIEAPGLAAGEKAGFLPLFLVDGTPRPGPFEIPRQYHETLLRRLKAMTDTINPLEKKKPQAGRVELLANGHPFTVEIKTEPVAGGETCVLSLNLDSFPGAPSRQAVLADVLRQLEGRIGDRQNKEQTRELGQKTAVLRYPEIDREVYRWAQERDSPTAQAIAFSFLAGYWSVQELIDPQTIESLARACAAAPVKSSAGGVFALWVAFQASGAQLPNPIRDLAQKVLADFLQELELEESQDTYRGETDEELEARQFEGDLGGLGRAASLTRRRRIAMLKQDLKQFM